MPTPPITFIPTRPTRMLRNSEDRFQARFPWVNQYLGYPVYRLARPGSRFRQELLRRSVISGWSAASRRDWDLVATRYATDAEITWDAEFEALGMGTYHGKAGLQQMSDDVEEAWAEWELLPHASIDLDGRIITLGWLRLEGNASGLEMKPEIAQLVTLKGALVVSENEYFGWDKGLRAAGLDPKEIRPLL